MTQTGQISTFTFKICGKAGDGSMATGELFYKLAQKLGYFVFDYREYPSAIRGGVATFQATASAEKGYSQKRKLDVLLMLDIKSGQRHIPELKKEGTIIFDEKEKIELSRNSKYKVFSLPFSEIVDDIGALPITKNTVAAGALCAYLSIDLKYVLESIEDQFSSKGNEVVEMNKKAAKNGYGIAKNKLNGDKVELKPGTAKNQIIISGNEASALGAIKAGCKFYAAYPMTPTTGVLHYLANKGPDFEMIVKQAEDEISVINMALGASFAGLRSMVSTSGGGFALMVEALGMSGMTETPLVIIMGSRGNPSTGMPTWTEQSDLNHVLYSGQGEFPRIVIAPGDQEEMFYLTAAAFNWADIYQLPVIVLTDKYLAESRATVDRFEQNLIKIDRGKIERGPTEGYKRYEITKDGISPRAFPGSGPGLVVANSDEHNEFGYTSEKARNRVKQMNKRMIKLKKAGNEMPKPEIFGPEEAEKTIISWGSTKGPILEAMKKLENVKYLHLNIIWPFPREAVHDALKNSKEVVLIENNFTSQLGDLIRQQTGTYIEKRLLKYDGRAFYPEEIVKFIKKVK